MARKKAIVEEVDTPFQEFRNIHSGKVALTRIA